jgi:hypothetical protein
MIRKVKVWNADVRPYSEEFKGEVLHFEGNGSSDKGYKIMEEPDAVQFMGQFKPFKKSPNGLEHGVKMLRMEIVGVSVDSLNDYICHACAQRFTIEKDLNAHILQAHEHQLDDNQKKALKKTATK